MMSFCVAQETYSVDGSNQYALKLEGTYVAMYIHVTRINN